MSERLLLIAVLLLGAALLLAWPRRHQRAPALLVLLSAANLASAAAIALRWFQVGYGPFLTLYEVLLSNVFSLGLVVTLGYLWVEQVSRGLFFALPVILMIGVWALSIPADPAKLPATFDSPWLWLHVGTGKLFLGMLLVAVGMAIAGLSGATDNPDSLDAAVWRFASLAFVFDSAMLLTGAVWANHAWGRYWNWDPVETWALITWLTLGLCLHARVTWTIPRRLGWALVTGVFVLAFLTLFGLPFLSIGPHKGVL